MNLRLDKVLCDAGWGSRKEVQNWIRKGLVTVDGVVRLRPESNVIPSAQEILLGNENVDWQEYYYIMMNKPPGLVSSTDDPAERTVLELLPARYRRIGLFPAGRLDKDATGLLLLTNDGELAHSWLSPKKHVDKKYFVTVEGCLSGEAAGRFRDGIELSDGTICKSAVLEPLSETQAYVTLREGKYHQIKRMMASVGCRVTGIHRLSMGTLELDDSLDSGGWKRIPSPK